MIVGTGDIASVLIDNDDKIFFASGVSNSQETSHSVFERESSLLRSQPKNKQLVYFSTLSIFYGDSEYIRHKKRMEDLVRSRFPYYAIIRIGNITWGNNPHTLINFIKTKIQNNERFEIRNEYRHLLTKSDFLFWLSQIPPNSKVEMCITGKMMLVKNIVNKLIQNTLLDYLAG